MRDSQQGSVELQVVVLRYCFGLVLRVSQKVIVVRRCTEEVGSAKLMDVLDISKPRFGDPRPLLSNIKSDLLADPHFVL